MKFYKVQIAILFSILAYSCNSTPLDDFVNDNSDRDYVKYKLISVTKYANYTRYKLNITTLKWFDGKKMLQILKNKRRLIIYFKIFSETFSNRPIWTHILYINKPKNYEKSPFAFLFSGIGDFINETSIYNTYVAEVAVKTRCLTATVEQIPNVPIKFVVRIEPIHRYAYILF